MLDFLLFCGTLLYLVSAIYRFWRSRGVHFDLLDFKRLKSLKYFNILTGAVMHWPEEWIAMGIALCTTAIAALLALMLGTLQIQAPYLVFLIAAVLADMWGGGFAGISASVLSVLFTWFFFMPPQWSFAFPTLGDGLTIALLFSVALLISRLWHNQRQTIDELIDENVTLRSRLQKLGRGDLG